MSEGDHVEAVILTVGQRHIFPMDCIAFETGEDCGDVGLSFCDGGDGMPRPHAAGACVVGSQSKIVAAEFCKVGFEHARAAGKVLVDVPDVGNALRLCGVGHQLGETCSAFVALRKGAVAAFLDDEGIKEIDGNAVSAGCVDHRWKVSRATKFDDGFETQGFPVGCCAIGLGWQSNLAVYPLRGRTGPVMEIVDEVFVEGGLDLLRRLKIEVADRSSLAWASQRCEYGQAGQNGIFHSYSPFRVSGRVSQVRSSWGSKYYQRCLAKIALSKGNIKKSGSKEISGRLDGLFRSVRKVRGLGAIEDSWISAESVKLHVPERSLMRS